MFAAAKMAAMHIYQKSSLEPVGRFPRNLVCSIGDSGPYVDLDIFYDKVNFGNYKAFFYRET